MMKEAGKRMMAVRRKGEKEEGESGRRKKAAHFDWCEST